MIPITAPGASGSGASAGGRRIPSRYSASLTKSALWAVYSSCGSTPVDAPTIRSLVSAYAARNDASARSASRNPTSSGSSWRAGGITWRWIRKSSPASTIAPTSIGRVAGKGVIPPWRWKPRPSSASVTWGISSGDASIPRSMIPLPGRPVTAVLPTCSTRVPGRTESTIAATRRATSTARGSQSWTAAARRS